MTEYQLHIERIEIVPNAELDLTEPPSKGHTGYSATFFLSGPTGEEQMRLVLTTQLQNPPAIPVKDLGPWLLGRLQNQISSTFQQLGVRQSAFVEGAASIRVPIPR